MLCYIIILYNVVLSGADSPGPVTLLLMFTYLLYERTDRLEVPVLPPGH
jgi:hypothetical protein